MGWAGLQSLLAAEDALREAVAISLETAHPAKFPEELQALTGIDPPLPASLQGLDAKPETYREMKTDYAAFKDYLNQEYR